MTQAQRFRVLDREDDVPVAPLALARHVVLRCAEAPVTFRAMLETARRDLVEALAPLVDLDTADVSTSSLLTDPRDVPLHEPATEVLDLFIEQRGPIPGLTQLWVSEFRNDGTQMLSLYMRMSRRDPFAVPAVLDRLRACADAGALPRGLPLESQLEHVLGAVAQTSSLARTELGQAVLRAQSFFPGSDEALVSLDVPFTHRAHLITCPAIWVPNAPLELRRHGTPEAALRAPSVEYFTIHTRQDGPLTDALLAARSTGERLLVEWEMSPTADLRSVSLVTHDQELEVELVVPGSVDFNYGPDPLDLLAWIAKAAGVELEYLESA